MPSFAEAIAINATSSHTYSAHLYDDWTIGIVPHGGIVTALFMKVAATHFSIIHSKQNQPHVISLHLEFLRRTEIGSCNFEVQDVKLGRQISNIHVSLRQGETTRVTGYIIMSNILTEKGPSEQTGYKLEPAPRPVDLRLLRKNEDKNYILLPEIPFAGFRKAIQKAAFYLPRQDSPSSDQWICMKNGERIVQACLGFVCDLFVSFDEQQLAKSVSSVDVLYWYPTLVLNIDIKKVLPPEGVEFLFVRCRSKQTKNGRRDLEFTVQDDKGDLVALSHHISLIVPSSRNLARRSDFESKI